MLDVASRSSSNFKVLLKEGISMNNVKNMSEGVLGLLGDQSKLLQERILSYCVWLSYNKVISVREAVESMLEEIL